MAKQRMRTAVGVLEAIKTDDPDTDVTLHYIRYIIKANLVPVVSAGRKKLVNVDAVLAYLEAGSDEVNAQPGQIRAMSE